MKRPDNPLIEIVENLIKDGLCVYGLQQIRREETDEDLRAEANRWDLEDWERDHSEPHTEPETHERQRIDYDSD